MVGLTDDLARKNRSPGAFLLNGGMAPPSYEYRALPVHVLVSRANRTQKVVSAIPSALYHRQSNVTPNANLGLGLT